MSLLFEKREISEVNKGRKMLEKMGWKKGEGLGKEGTGMKDPVRSILLGFCHGSERDGGDVSLLLLLRLS